MKTAVEQIISSAKDTDEALEQVLTRIKTDLINSEKEAKKTIGKRKRPSKKAG